MIAQALGIAVAEVRGRDQATLTVRLVADERNPLADLGPKRRPGQADPSADVVEGERYRIPPGQPITGVVDLVQDHQAAPAGGPGGVQGGLTGYLGVRGYVTVQVARHRPDTIGEGRIQRDAELLGSLGPLAA